MNTTSKPHQDLPFADEFSALKEKDCPQKIDIADATMDKIYEELRAKKRRRLSNRIIAASLIAACFVGVIFITSKVRESNENEINFFLAQVYLQDDLHTASFDEEFIADITFE